MEKIRNSNLLKRTLVLVLCLALGAGILPVNDYSVKVEAATNESEGVYKMKIGDAGEGFHEITADKPYAYSGLKDRTTLQIKGIVNGNETFLKGIKYTWKSSAPEVISVDGDGEAKEDKYEADITRKGPGVATITVNFTPKDSNSTISISRVISVSTEIDKSSTKASNTERDPFTKLVETGEDSNNTALVFFKDENDTNDKKVIELLNGTQSRPNTVRWTTSNSDIAIVEQEEGEIDKKVYERNEKGELEEKTIKVPKPVTVTAKKAGVATITAEAISSPKIKDSFKVIVMPRFKGEDTNGKTVFKKSLGSNNALVSMAGKDEIITNAIDAQKLKWTVKDITGKTKTDMLTIEPEKGSSAYIGKNPRAGAYQIIAQTVQQGLAMDEHLGIARAYVKIPIKVPNNRDLVLGLNDTYDILENFNFQSYNDLNVRILSPSTGEESHNVTTVTPNGVIVAKDIGLSKVVIRLNEGVMDKYGIKQYKDKDAEKDEDKYTEEYLKYVKNGITLNFFVVDGFGINNSNITMYLKSTANLTLTTTSNEPITWVSSNDKVVQITSSNGTTCGITALQVGEAVITVTQKVNGVTKSARCVVKVINSAESITIDPPVVDMDVDETKMLTAKLTPNDMVVGNLKWSSSDEKVVKIDSYNGKNAVIKGVGDGVATITVINTENAIIGTCKVTVHGKTSGITITPDKATVQLADKTLQLNAVVQPSTNVQPELTWMSSDTSIATVDNKGLVTLKDGGTVKITVFIKKNPAVSATATITIQRSVAGLKLDQSSKIMFAGEKYKLGYTLTPPDASNKNIKWTSAKPSVASVDKDGNILAISPGETIIMAQTEDGRYTDYCIVTVKQLAKNIKITTKDVFVNKGNKHKIEYPLEPANATDVSIQWESMNPKIATVDQKGEVTAVEVGSTTILAKLAGEVAYCNVTVIEKATGIKLNYSEKVVYKNKTFALKASIEPEGATNRKVTFVSSKPSVATVTGSGTVKGISPGTALITVTSDDGGHKAICVVIVKEMTTSIKLNHTFYALGLHDTFTLVPKVTSNNATDKKVSFTSSNPAIAAVNSKGQVTGKKLGYANITVRALDGSGVKATCRVRVVVPTKSIKLNRTVMTMIVGRTTKLKPAFSPKNTSYKTAKWTSSNTDIVKVLEDGTVIALSPGTAVITAASKDSGGKKKAVCYVTVREAVPSNGITVTSKNPVMVVGEKFTMSAVLTPYNSTDSVTWESDNTAIASVGRTTGTITAKTSGVASITAISSGGKVSTTTVTVVGLDINNITLEQYTNFTISVIGAPAGVFWQSENPSIATVQNGKIITRSAGSTRIVANVRGRRLYCNVRVIPIR